MPLFGVLLADWLVARAHYREEDVFAGPSVRAGMIAAWVAGFALYQWLYPTGPSWWVDAVSELDPPSVAIGATVPSFAVSFVLALAGRLPDASAGTSIAAVRGMAVIGNLTRDVIDGGRPRVGGAPYHAARALRLLGGRARIVARCAEADRRVLLPPLVALGVPVAWLAAARTTSFALRYSGEERTMYARRPRRAVDRRGRGRRRPRRVDPGRRAHASRLPARRARRARARPPARARRPGARAAGAHGASSRHDADFDPAMLRHVTVLKLAESEAETIGGEEGVAALGVPEVLLTLGSRGALLLAGGRREPIPVRRIDGGDPTGAGDAFLAGYVWARAAGHRPLSAARHAASIAARVLEVER